MKLLIVSIACKIILMDKPFFFFKKLVDKHVNLKFRRIKNYDD